MKKNDWLTPILTALFVGVIFLFVISPVRVNGRSMNPTLETNDQGVVLRHKKPERFDIVILESHDKKEKLYIKRVIGLPGERLTFKDGKLFVNNKEYKEPYLDKKLAFDENGQTLTGNFEVEVPKDSYYVLGDNRGHSNDSRALGPIKKKDIDGVFVWRFWPFNKMQIF